MQLNCYDAHKHTHTHTERHTDISIIDATKNKVHLLLRLDDFTQEIAQSRAKIIIKLKKI